MCPLRRVSNCGGMGLPRGRDRSLLITSMNSRSVSSLLTEQRSVHWHRQISILSRSQEESRVSGRHRGHRARVAAPSPSAQSSRRTATAIRPGEQNLPQYNFWFRAFIPVQGLKPAGWYESQKRSKIQMASILFSQVPMNLWVICHCRGPHYPTFRCSAVPRAGL